VKSLAARTILGFTQLIVYLGAALFVPAWTLDFWQAWVYLSIFAAASVLIAAYLWKCDRKLLERRVKAGPLAEKDQRQKLIQLLASVVARPAGCRHCGGRPCNIWIPCRLHRVQGEHLHLSDN
jgi:membrane protein implicated in regulation of membrane protease activity